MRRALGTQTATSDQRRAFTAQPDELQHRFLAGSARLATTATPVRDELSVGLGLAEPDGVTVFSFVGGHVLYTLAVPNPEPVIPRGLGNQQSSHDERQSTIKSACRAEPCVAGPRRGMLIECSSSERRYGRRINASRPLTGGPPRLRTSHASPAAPRSVPRRPTLPGGTALDAVDGPRTGLQMRASHTYASRRMSAGPTRQNGDTEYRRTHSDGRARTVCASPHCGSFDRVPKSFRH
jgi:hypothetical protein